MVTDNTNTATEIMDDAALDQAWDSDEDFVETTPAATGTQQPADQQEPPAEQQEAPAVDQPAAEPVAGPELFTIKNRDETRQVTREELVAMAQKGWDYDTVRQERDQLRQYRDENRQAVEFLTGIARKNGMDVKGYLEEIQKRELMQTGMSEAEASRELQMRQREEQVRKGQAELEAQRQKENAAQQQSSEKEGRIRSDVAGFLKAYPQVKPADIPKQVWDRVNQGETLVAAYAQHDAAQQKAEVDRLKAEVAALQQNKSNAQRTPGSLGGNSGTELDEIDRLWNDDD